jgi:patatin-like phospholipase/acyl hydrolase
MSDVMDFINSAGSGFDSFQFDNVGDTIDGTIVNDPRIIEKANQNTGNMDKILVLDIHTADDKDWTLMCGIGGRISAIREALQNANASKLEVGGRLVMKYTGNAPKKPGKPQAAKLYTAAYVAPAPSGVNVSDLLGG